MSDEAAFQCTYSHIKAVKGRGVVQIILEAPIEHWPTVNSVLGPPTTNETWVAVARIQAPQS